LLKMDKVRLRATIIIEFEADDFAAAAVHQNRLKEVTAGLSENYPDVVLSLRERRDRRPKEAEVKPLRLTTGRMHRYS
jgi:hypothetical protein